MKNDVLKVEYIATSKISPYANNSRTHSDKQVGQVVKSIREFGSTNPILIDEVNVVIAGHCRLLAAQKLQLATVPTIRLTGLTDKQRRAYVIADNKLGLNAGWDDKTLRDEMSWLYSIGYDLDTIGFSVGDIADAGLGLMSVDEDDYVHPKTEPPKSARGDIYRLGRHRLMCGDSTSHQDVRALMSGESAQLLLTDPPYNVNYVGKSKSEMIIQNDAMPSADFIAFLQKAFACAKNNMVPGAVFYVWHSDATVGDFSLALRNCGMRVRQILIWAKNNLAIGGSDYQNKHEPCLYGWLDGAHKWRSDRKQTTLLEFDRVAKCDIHPTMKPVALFDYLIRNSTDSGDNVLDLFGGSGTTIVACEKNERDAFLMEIDPVYVDAIIGRWENITGDKAVKIG